MLLDSMDPGCPGEADWLGGGVYGLRAGAAGLLATGFCLWPGAACTVIQSLRPRQSLPPHTIPSALVPWLLLLARPMLGFQHSSRPIQRPRGPRHTLRPCDPRRPAAACCLSKASQALHDTLGAGLGAGDLPFLTHVPFI